MTTIVDRRGQSKNGQVTSRRRFLDRNRKSIRDAMDKKIADGKIGDIGKDGVDVTVPRDDIHEPNIKHGKGGKHQRVFPGNRHFRKGDELEKPPGGGGGRGTDGSPDGDGEDDFTFHVTEDEFLEMLFEDLELPNLTKVGDQDTTKTKSVPAGLSSDGPPNKLDLARSVQKRMGRRISAANPSKKAILELKEEQRDILKSYVSNDDDPKAPASKSSGFVPLKTKIKQIDSEIEHLRTEVGGELSPEDAEEIDSLDKEIESLENKINKIPKWDDKHDMVYKLNKQQPVPTSKAVMFCLMDVSGSMGEEEKSKAKLFYFLLNRFLERHYEHTEVVFIRHTHVAQEVDEETFFYDRETGGTVASTCLEKMLEAIKDRFPPSEWNIYGAQATDGDNYPQDNINVQDFLEQIMPKVQAYFYTEIDRGAGLFGPRIGESDLWRVMQNFEENYPGKFFTGMIKDKSDIFPVFREFFKQRETYDAEQRPSVSSLNAFSGAAP